MVTVLLVEDDLELAAAASAALTLDGFAVVRAGTLAAALEQVDGCDIALLDLGLPDADSYSACSALLETGVPVVVATARDAEIDRVVCLELGADDYVVKPYLMREVGARLRAVLRRAGAQPPGRDTDDLLVLGALQVSDRNRTAQVAGADVDLTAKEFDLLVALLREPGKVHRRDVLLRGVWGADFVGSGRTLDTHVASLRRKLGNPDWIVSSRRVGYRIEDPGHR